MLHLGRRGQGRAAAYGSIAAFGLAGLGAWIGRSGTLTSVHAFADARAVGWGVLALLAVGAVVVVVARRPSVADAEVGRRAWVVPAVFAGVGVVVLAGTLWPLVPLLVGGERRVVAGTYFAAFAAPAALGLLALLGVRRNGPAVAALVAGVGAALALRLPPYAAGVCALGPAVMVGLAMQRRRTGVLLAHAGAVVLLAGVAGATLATRQTAAIVPGDHARLAGVSVTSAGTASISTSSRTGVAAVLDIDGHELRPALVRVPGADGVRGDVALRSTPARDVQISLERTEADGTVVVTVTNRPLAQAVWWGAALLAVGGALTVRRPRRPAAEPAPDPALAAA